MLCEARGGDEVLVHGVTGSGKTEVYLQAAQSVLEHGRSVLLLVPEIGLTGQTVARVRERFVGQDVAVLHSGLTARERLLAYRAVASGQTRIVVGARSAVFAPLRDLGLIVVDEEHDTSFKQESEPAYDARTVARWRAEASGAVVVLGSATPSVESFARVPLHADLRRRVDGSQPPALEIVDMRDHHGVFSTQLAEGAGRHGGRRRQGDPLPQPARVRLVPRLRPLRLHAGCARTATSRSRCSAAAACAAAPAGTPRPRPERARPAAAPTSCATASAPSASSAR